jgi:hypothetical protein
LGGQPARVYAKRGGPEADAKIPVEPDGLSDRARVLFRQMYGKFRVLLRVM